MSGEEEFYFNFICMKPSEGLNYYLFVLKNMEVRSKRVLRVVDCDIENP